VGNPISIFPIFVRNQAFPASGGTLTAVEIQVAVDVLPTLAIEIETPEIAVEIETIEIVVEIEPLEP
jgi:hypothetical protein